MVSLSRLLLVVAGACLSNALNNGLALTPQMGWNSWNHFACNVNQDVIKQTVDTFISTGLADAGYNYVNVDDCWASSRLPNRTVVSDPTTFSEGMKSLADYAHSKGLLFGLYSDAGNETCAGRPGSLDFEKIDAMTYASWGVDYLKYDNCNNEGIKPEVRYPVMRDALNSTGRPIFYSLCEWGVDNPATWAPSVGNSWRTTGDISDNWASMIQRADWNDAWWKHAGPGGWNDPDMLEVGNGGMTDTEYRTHFSLWSLMKSPLLIGCDITKMSDATKEILMNHEVIAVNQDPLGVQGHKRTSSNGLEVWSGPLVGNTFAVILLNRSGSTSTVTAHWSDIDISAGSSCFVRDLWKHAYEGQFTGSYSASVESHGVVMLKIVC